jgi:putative ABC transport system permease protein
MTIHVRAAGDPRALAEPVRRVLASVNVDLPAAQARTLAEHISASTFVPRTGAMVVGAFALMALLLSVIGMYGALSFAVALRSREIALRLALGAQQSAMAGRVIRQALAIAGAGIAAGGVLAFVGGSLVRARIPQVAAGDPLIAVGTALVLLIVTAIASWIPARHAMRVDPAVALRVD